MVKILDDKNKAIRNNIGVFFLGIYILTGYIAQEGLLPTIINSLALYAFIGISALYLCVKVYDLKLPNFSIWYFGLLALSLVSFLYGDYMVTSAAYVMFVSLILSFCFIITLTDYVSIDLVARFYIWSSVIMSFMLLVTDQLIFDVEEGERLGQDLSGNANAFSAMVMSATIFAAWYMVYRCSWKTKWLYLLAFVSQLFVMGLSGGRKTVVAVLACAITFIFFSSNNKRTPFARNALICIILLLTVYWSIMNIPILYDSIGERFEAFFSDLFGFKTAAAEVGGDKIRERLVEIGIDGWLESPIFGHGLDTFKYFNKDMTGHFYYAHNNYVELLYDLGLVGFIAYYSFVVYMLVKLVKMPRKLIAYKMLGLGLLLELFVYDIGGVSFYATFSICVLAIVYAIIILASCEEKQTVKGDVY